MNVRKIYFRPFPRDKLSGLMRITRYDCGRVAEHTASTRILYTAPTRKLDNEHYVIVATGEVKEFQKHSKTREENVGHVIRTINNLRRLINANELCASSLWVTLTYAENMRDTKRLYDDYRKFQQKFYRFCQKNGWSKPEYICCVEPQERGAWHIHGLFMWYDNNAPKYIANKVLGDMWGHGFVNVQRATKVRNLGTYISSYLACTKGKKRNRLYMYPVGLNIYRASRGVRKPEKTVAVENNHEFGEEVTALMWSCGKEYLDENQNTVNTLYKWNTLESVNTASLVG